jgi:uncharacterized membrane protein YciS (DUF1049 family)
MKWLKSIVLAAAMLLAFVLAALAVNQQELTLSFAIWETPFALSMFWWLLAAFLVGLSFGLLNAIWLNVKHRLQLRQLRQNLANTTAELERLRSLTVQS